MPKYLSLVFLSTLFFSCVNHDEKEIIVFRYLKNVMSIKNSVDSIDNAYYKYFDKTFLNVNDSANYSNPKSEKYLAFSQEFKQTFDAVNYRIDTLNYPKSAKEVHKNLKLYVKIHNENVKNYYDSLLIADNLTTRTDSIMIDTIDKVTYNLTKSIYDISIENNNKINQL